MSKHCYKIKSNFLKNDRLKDYGFLKYLDEYETPYWAIPLTINEDTMIAKDLKSQLELIYTKGNEEAKKELIESGYEFDKDGKLIINETFLKDLKGQLCVSVDYYEEDRGCLFFNIDGMEWYYIEEVQEIAKDTIEALSKDNALYRKRL